MVHSIFHLVDKKFINLIHPIKNSINPKEHYPFPLFRQELYHVLAESPGLAPSRPPDDDVDLVIDNATTEEVGLKVGHSLGRRGGRGFSFVVIVLG